MPCYYFKSDAEFNKAKAAGFNSTALDGATFTGDDANELRYKILAQLQNLSRLSLSFLSANLNSNTENALTNAEKAYDVAVKAGKSAVGVTTWIENNTEKVTESLTDELRFIRDFSKINGTYIHRLKEVILDIPANDDDAIEDAIKDVLDNGFKDDLHNTTYPGYRKDLKNQIAEFDKLNSAVLALIRSNYQSIANFIDYYRENVDKDTIIGNIKDSINSIINEEKKFLQQKLGVAYKQRAEVKVGCQASNKSYVKSSIDSIAYNDNGIIILDYKTSARGVVSTTAHKKHVMQLRTYKRFLQLADRNITNEDVSMFNVVIKYRPNGKFGIDESSFVDALSGLSQKDSSIIDSTIEHSFPLSFEDISQEEILKFTEITTKQWDKIRKETKVLQKKEADMIKTELDKCLINHTKFYSGKFNKAGDLKKNDNGTYSLVTTKRDGSVTELYSQKTLEEIAKEESQAAVSELKSRAGSVRDVINGKDINRLAQVIGSVSAGDDVYKSLYKYIGSDWTAVRTPLEEFGIITIKNSANTYDFIILTPHRHLKYSPANGQHIMCYLDSLQPGKLPADMPRYDLGNAYLIKGMLALGNYAKYVKDNFTVGDIKAMSITSGHATPLLNTRAYLDGIKYAARIDSDFADTYDRLSKLKYQSQTKNIYDETMNALEVVSTSDSRDYTLVKGFNDLDAMAKVEAINALKKEIIRQHPTEFAESKVTDRKQETLAQIAVGQLDLLSASILGIVKDPSRVTKHGITWQDTGRFAWEILKYGAVNQYTDLGTLISGFAGGLDSSTVYNNPDALLREALKLIISYTSAMKQEMVKECEEVNKATLTFFENLRKAGLLGITDPLIGAHDRFYEELFAKNPNGERLMELEDPFNPKQNLATYQLEYIEVLLWAMNKHKLSFSREEAPKYRKMTWQEFKKSDKYTWYKGQVSNDVRYRQLPLRENGGLKSFVEGIADIKNKKWKAESWGKALKSYMKRAVEPTKLASEQREQQLKDADMLKTFNRYREDPTTRAKKLEENPSLAHWEKNLNFLINDFTYSYVKEQCQDRLLPIVGNIVGALGMILGRTGLDLRPQMENILSRVKISVYNTNLIDPEHKDLITIVGAAKHITSLAKIAARPLLMGKELLVGRLKNTSTIAAGLWVSTTGNKVTLKNLAFGEKTALLGGINSGATRHYLKGSEMGDFNMLEQINNLFCFTDRDATVMSEAMSVDRYGVMNLSERILYYNTVRPDWYNRMALVVATMQADGVWDAHTLVNGKLVYSMAKDARFSEYYAHKNDPKYTSVEFLRLKSLYHYMLNQFISAGVTNPDGTPLKEGDDLLMCYTTELVNSLKEQIGSLYGMYDHEEKTIIQNELSWNMWMQFATFLPGDIHRYFMKRGLNSIGYMDLLKNEDNLPLYYEDDLQLIYTTEEKDENGNPREPVTVFRGTPAQGIAVSAGAVIGKCLRRDWKGLDTPEGKREMREASIFLFQLLWGILCGSLIMSLIAAGREASEMSLMANMASDVLHKSTNELSLALSVFRPIADLDFAGVEEMYKLGSDVTNVMAMGEKTLYDALSANFIALRDFDNSSYAL